MPSGFVRLIEPNHSYLGYLKDMVYTQPNRGIYFKHSTPVYTGIWGEGQRWKYDQPSSKLMSNNEFRF